jgi:hypothetical protein
MLIYVFKKKVAKIELLKAKMQLFHLWLYVVNFF